MQNHNSVLCFILCYNTALEGDEYQLKKRLIKAALVVCICLLAVSCSENPVDLFDKPVGFVTLGEGITGGQGGKMVIVRSGEDFTKYVQAKEPYIIQVSGTIPMSGMTIVESNKTIIGMGSTAAITGGGLRLRASQNVIIRNISFSGSPDDLIGIDKSARNIWIDHNNFSDSYDGLVDIKEASSFITISWNKFHDHDKTSLVGAGDQSLGDRDKLKVTYHHNWFAGTNQRHPRIRFGEVHLLNNYYDSVKSYGIGVGVEAKVYSEKNYFENVKNVFSYAGTTAKQPGYIKDVGSLLVNSIERDWNPDGVTWEPSSYYKYKADEAKDVKTIVMSGAGVGKIHATETETRTSE